MQPFLAHENNNISYCIWKSNMGPYHQPNGLATWLCCLTHTYKQSGVSSSYILMWFVMWNIVIATHHTSTGRDVCAPVRCFRQIILVTGLSGVMERGRGPKAVLQWLQHQQVWDKGSSQKQSKTLIPLVVILVCLLVHDILYNVYTLAVWLLAYIKMW